MTNSDWEEIIAEMYDWYGITANLQQMQDLLSDDLTFINACKEKGIGFEAEGYKDVFEG